MLSALPKPNFSVSVAFILSSANVFNLEKSKYLSSATDLNQVNHHKINSLTNDNILDQSNLKDFADDKINVTYLTNFVLGREKNIVGKGENAGYHFLLFPQCFQKVSLSVS